MWNDSTTTGAVGYLRRKAEFINSRGKEGMRLFWCRSCFP